MKPFDKIIETLLINGTLTEQAGLFYGKTGVAIFFFHHARHTGNELFADYAMDLIEEVQKQINEVKYPARYDIGLAGIGAGFEYILQNGFLETNDSGFFEDFDARMYRTVMYEPYPDFSLENGLSGWGRYFVCRLRGNGHKDSRLHQAMVHIVKETSQKIAANAIPESEQPDVFRFLCDLVTLTDYAGKYDNLLLQCKQWACIREPDMQTIFPRMNNLQRFYTCQKYLGIDLSEEIEKEWEKWQEAGNESLTGMGLLKGWAREGLLHLTSINKDETSWINLL